MNTRMGDATSLLVDFAILAQRSLIRGYEMGSLFLFLPVIGGLTIAFISALEVYLVTGGEAVDRGVAFSAFFLSGIIMLTVGQFRDDLKPAGQDPELCPLSVEIILYCNVILPTYVWVWKLTQDNFLLNLLVLLLFIVITLAVWLGVPLLFEGRSDDQN